MGAPGNLGGPVGVRAAALFCVVTRCGASRVLPVPLPACDKGTATPRGILNP